jgi:protocatechuate 3,4-dioxygenase beta subunit
MRHKSGMVLTVVGLYENQDPGQADMNLCGKFTTDAEGRFWFSTVKVVGYPIRRKASSDAF